MARGRPTWDSVDDVLTKHQCNSIIQKAQERLQKAEAEDDSRKSYVAPLTFLDLGPDAGINLLNKLVDSNQNNFKFKIDYKQLLETTYQVIKYTRGDGYSWHMDVGPDENRLRKLSAIVQLSDSQVYRGGEVQGRVNDTPFDFPKTQGSLITFPSYLQHRVNPVTDGVRWSLVCWMEGENEYE